MAGAFPRRALVSVSNKTGLVPFIRRLVELGFEIISTGGTRRTLHEQGLPVIDIAEYTGFPEIMDGRVKTLHPKVHGAILGRPDLPEDAAAIKTHGIIPFELVVVNLYPFEETIAKPDVELSEAVEQIDIGGPSMVRSAAKNHAYIGIVTKPEQYDRVLEALNQGSLSLEFRRELAAAAFEMTACYDRAIADFLSKSFTTTLQPDKFPVQLNLRFQQQQELRYGENPHQGAAFYTETPAPVASLASSKQRHGKELSYNNLLDLDSALNLVREFSDAAAVVLKHNNPCGAAVAENLSQAFRKAYAGDPVSAFGSIIGFNREVDAATAEELCQPDRFVEAIIAPGYSGEAFNILTTKPKWRANVRLLECPTLLADRPASLDFRRVSGGLLVQDRDEMPYAESEWKVVSKRAPTPEEWADLKFGWRVAKHVKSNAIVFVKGGMVVGVGAGQMSRLDSCQMAGWKAGERARGGVVASDAFFPFRDGVDVAFQNGITAAIEPGGSKKDDEVIAACDEHNMALVFTGHRHFRH